MKPIYVYPASFCPPTFGHLHNAEKAAKLFSEVYLICSVNPDKKKLWFTPEECQILWQSYDLPKNIHVKILGALKKHVKDMSQLCIIRGIRDVDDAEYEKQVMIYNRKKFKIDKYFYLFSEDEFIHISSSKVRNLALNLRIEELYNYVSPLVTSKLLEKSLKINNLFMVVGRPGMGKSTFLKMLTEEDNKNIHIDTDELNKKLKPLIKKNFYNKDLINVAVNKSEELKKLITKPWLNLLKKKLKKVPTGTNVFVEIPYGMQLDKKMFRFAGGKVIHVNCRKDVGKKRIKEKGYLKLLPFIEKIPDLKETKKIIKQNKLSLISVDNNGSINELKKKAKKLNSYLNKKDATWKTCRPGVIWEI